MDHGKNVDTDTKMTNSTIVEHDTDNTGGNLCKNGLDKFSVLSDINYDIKCKEHIPDNGVEIHANSVDPEERNVCVDIIVNVLLSVTK